MIRVALFWVLWTPFWKSCVPRSIHQWKIGSLCVSSPLHLLSQHARTQLELPATDCDMPADNPPARINNGVCCI